MCGLKKTLKAFPRALAQVKRFSLRTIPLVNVRFFQWKLFPVPVEAILFCRKGCSWEHGMW